MKSFFQRLHSSRKAVHFPRLATLTLCLAPAAFLSISNAQPAAQQPAPGAAAQPAQQGGRGGRGGIPGVTPSQTTALTQITTSVASLAQAATDAHSALVTAAFGEPASRTAVDEKVGALRSAEAALANARADAFAKVQASTNKLSEAQISAFAAAGGVAGARGGGGAGGGGGGFSQPAAYDFNNHDGYVSLFDGVSLKGWDGNPKFWRVEDGAIVGESTPTNPSGNTYLVYRDLEAKDLDLKFEIKIIGSGGSGVQYRSQTGIPWRRGNSATMNLDWMMTGPQADFWPSQVYSGQFYTENDPMGILAWRGQVVEGFGAVGKRLMGTIGDRTELGRNYVKQNDWNEYTVIARGGTFVHIMNGQIMAVMIDDDPNSVNNKSGYVGIEIEQITKVFVRNIWMKKIN